jgi:hypothetical protein
MHVRTVAFRGTRCFILQIYSTEFFPEINTFEYQDTFLPNCPWHTAIPRNSVMNSIAALSNIPLASQSCITSQNGSRQQAAFRETCRWALSHVLTVGDAAVWVSLEKSNIMCKHAYMCVCVCVCVCRNRAIFCYRTLQESDMFRIKTLLPPSGYYFIYGIHVQDNSLVTGRILAVTKRTGESYQRLYSLCERTDLMMAWNSSAETPELLQLTLRRLTTTTAVVPHR